MTFRLFKRLFKLSRNRLEKVRDLRHNFHYWDATEEFSRDDKNQAGFTASVGRGPTKGGKPNGVPYNFGKGGGTKGKGKMHKGLGFQPERGETRKFSLDTVIDVGESAIRKPSVGFKQEYMKSNPSQDPLQRDIREWSKHVRERARSQPAQGQR